MKYNIDGYTVIIDEDDFEKIKPFTWHVMQKKALQEGLYYFSASMREGSTGRWHNQFLHRFIMKCRRGDGLKVDHKNHNTLDCRKENLRICTSTENNQNARVYRAKKDGFKGIKEDTSTGHYLARIQSPEGKRIMLGTYATAEEAAKAYDRGALYYFKEFAVTNFPKESYTEYDMEHLDQSMDIPSKRNSSGYVGVTWNSPNKNWKARYISDGRTKWLGTYKDPYEAYLAREKYIAELKEGK